MREMRSQGSSGRTADRQHEPKDMSVRAVALFGLGLLLVLVAVHFGLGALFGVLRRSAERRDVQPSVMAEPRAMPPAPRLEVSPQRNLEAVRRAEDRNLGGYGWIDRSKGIVRIPLDRGLPTGKAPERDAGDH